MKNKRRLQLELQKNSFIDDILHDQVLLFQKFHMLIYANQFMS